MTTSIYNLIDFISSVVYLSHGNKVFNQLKFYLKGKPVI